MGSHFFDDLEFDGPYCVGFVGFYGFLAVFGGEGDAEEEGLLLGLGGDWGEGGWGLGVWHGL